MRASDSRSCAPQSDSSAIPEEQLHRSDNADPCRGLLSKAWPFLFPQHGPGRKHERRIGLVDWQQNLVAERPELLLRGLIHSDGCRFINTGRNWSHPRYSFRNRSEGILSIFCHACDLAGVRHTRAPYTVYVSRKADVAFLDTFIGPKA